MKKHFNLLFLLTVFGITLWTVFRGEDFSQVVEALGTANLLYIAPGVICVLLFIIGESVVIHYLMRTLGEKIRFGNCCMYSFIGFFYSCITPSASGGQPMQVIAMRRDGVPVAVSTVVLAIVTITYKLVLVLLGAAVLLIRPPQLMAYLAPVEPVMYLGMGLNVIAIALLLLLVFDPRLVRGIGEWALGLVNRIRPLREPEKKYEKLNQLVAQYTGAADYYRAHKRAILNVLLITLAQRMILFFVTWLTYRAFALQGHGMPVIVLLQGMIAVASDMMPLPGGMGVSENLFLEIFQPIFGEALVLPGMIISRGVSFYTQLLISGVMTIVAELRTNDKRKGEETET